MDWFDDCIDRLISGDSLNITGLSGSGRSAAIREIERRLDPQDWSTTLLTLDQARSMSRKQLRTVAEELGQKPGLPVLLIDDFGLLLMEDNGPWLDRMLFSLVQGDAARGSVGLRCVVVTHPRDREVVGASSVVRERCHDVTPPLDCLIDGEAPKRFGCSSATEVLELTGGNAHLLSAGGISPAERRGQLPVAARAHLPSWVGELDAGHQQRLAAVLSRPAPARWKHDDADPILAPVVLQSGPEDDARCFTPACITPGDVVQLLVGEPWPAHDPVASAKRFAARCGNEPTPLWVDNYLSDAHHLDFALLARLIHELMDRIPSMSRLRVLSRDWVDGQRIYPLNIQNALNGVGLRADAQARIDWRLYDQRRASNLHRRELLLPHRGSAFTLPPAQILVGQADAGNETDAATSIASSRGTLAVWRDARPVFGPTTSSSP